jgi:acyl carrier protein/RimJ/RimL family protein N-acetyltransferase
MDAQTVRDLVLETLHAVAPDAGAIPLDRPLREAIDLDSMDWVNFMAGLEERLAMRIAPADEKRLATVNGIVDHVVSHPAAPGAPSSQTRPAAVQAPGALPCTTLVVRGTPVEVRPMRNDDMALEAEFVQRLSSRSRYQRFMVSLRELPPAKLMELTQVDQQRHVALVAVVMRDGRPALAGVVRYIVDASGTGCEFALAIDDAWQGSGLAGILMHLLMTVARTRGLATMEGTVLRTNDRMLKLGRQLGFRREGDFCDRDTVRLVRLL